jgi:small-conductance mechanosensitive channel
MLPINLITVFVSALVAFILGFLFHGPLLGKLWMKLANIHPTGNEKFKDMIPQMLWNLLSNFVTAYVLAVIYLFVSLSPFLSGPGAWTSIVIALWIWLGFLVTSSSIEVIWMGKNYKLWLFECGCSLIVMISMGAIIGGF